MTVFEILKIIGFVVCCFLVVTGYLLLINAIDNVGGYFNQKKNELANKINNPRFSLSSKISVTEELFELIDSLIISEFGGVLHRFAVLNQVYPTIRIDNDIKETANIVYKAFKPELFNDIELCVTDEYILKYITERTKILALTSVVDYNRALQVSQGLYDPSIENGEE